MRSILHILLLFLSSIFLYSPLLSSEPTTHPENHRSQLLHIFAGEWVSRAVYTAVKLDIPELLAEGPQDINTLAKMANADTSSLYRLLHMLAAHGVFEERENQVFSNNSSSMYLSSKHPHSLASLCQFYGEEIHSVWDALPESIRKGVPAFQLTYNQPVFSYFKENPKSAKLFQAAMKEKSQAVIESALSAYDYSQYHNIYDIGGGQGQFLKALVKKHPQLTATLFELPEVIATLPASSSFELSPGNFFEAIPEDGDLYVLKSVLHDWDDEQAISILHNCHQAMSKESKLLIVEVVLQSTQDALYANDMDLLMMAITGGKERSLESFTTMFEKAGFSIEKIYPTSTEFSVIELSKL